MSCHFIFYKFSEGKVRHFNSTFHTNSKGHFSFYFVKKNLSNQINMQVIRKYPMQVWSRRGDREGFDVIYMMTRTWCQESSLPNGWVDLLQLWIMTIDIASRDYSSWSGVNNLTVILRFCYRHAQKCLLKPRVHCMVQFFHVKLSNNNDPVFICFQLIEEWLMISKNHPIPQGKWKSWGNNILFDHHKVYLNNWVNCTLITYIYLED